MLCGVSGVEFSVDRVNTSRVWLRTAPACLLQFTDDSSPAALRHALQVGLLLLADISTHFIDNLTLPCFVGWLKLKVKAE